ncbi:MAG: hypothetical protein NXI27_04485 [Alphaproteobacteria bacterium]|nr:hypothetical protein [Alphaproteobacteria bacterium]
MAAAGEFRDLDLPQSALGIGSQNRFLPDAFLLAVITFVSYLALSWQFTGPTYLTDEIGYLTNAAALSGRSIDAASSYHFGYSLFLVPGFLLFEEPTTIWKAVLVTNAVLFAGAVFLLHRISGFLSSERLPRISAVGLCALYPAYPTMTGYAFSTPAMILVFVAACWMLCQSAFSPARSLSVFALLVGFLTWIHPSGLPVGIAAALTLALMCWMDRRLIVPAMTAALIIIVMILSYQQVLQPLLRNAMTPEGFQPKLHYPSPLDELALVASLDGVVHVLTKYVGQMAYILAGTLALASGGVAYTLLRVAAVSRNRNGQRPETIGLLVFGLFSILGMVAVTSLSNNLTPVIWANEWFSGRHLEAVLLPFLLFSFLLCAPRIYGLIITTGVFALVFLFHLTNRRETLDLNEIEGSSFWPTVLFPDGTMLQWFFWGGLACVLAVFVPVRIVKLFLVGLYLMCIGNQIEWHHQSFWVNGRPSELSQFIRDTYPVNSCIAFEPREDRSDDIRRYERLNQLTYYLMNFRFRRMEVSDWIERCDGPYLTYRDHPALADAGAVVIAQELYTGLKAYARKTVGRREEGRYAQVFVRMDHEDRPATFLARVNSSNLAGHLGVGELIDGSIVSNKRSGHVFFGPYGYLDAGRYRFHAFGSATDIEKSWFDLVSEGGNRIHHTFPLEEKETGQDRIASGNFEIPADMKNFEIRLNADANANIVFSHYELERLAD